MAHADDAEQVYRRAQEAERLRDLGQAEALYRSFCELCPDDPRGPNRLGVLHALRREFDEAERYFAQALSLNSRFAPAWTNTGNVRLERGDIAGAVACHKEALAIDPNYAEAHQNLAVALKRLGKIPPMVRHLRQAQRGYRDRERRRVGAELRGCLGREVGVLVLAVAGAVQIGVLWR